MPRCVLKLAVCKFVCTRHPAHVVADLTKDLQICLCMTKFFRLYHVNKIGGIIGIKLKFHLYGLCSLPGSFGVIMAVKAYDNVLLWSAVQL